MTHWRLFSTFVIVATFTAVITPQTPSGHAVFEQALAKERVDGNLPEAIRLYERVVTEFATDRALAAKALVQVGLCYEKLGRQEAIPAYERLVRDFGDQEPAAKQARARLAALAKAPTPAPATSPARRLVADWGTWRPSTPADGQGTLTRDARSLLRYNQQQRAFELLDLGTGDARRLTSEGPAPQEAVVSGFFTLLSRDGRTVAAEVRVPTSRPTVYERFELRVFEVGGRGPGRVLTTWDGQALFQARPFAWSPGNDRVWLFVMRSDKSAQIASLDMNGKLEVLKTLTWRDHTQPPSLSPDGRFVAYHDATSRDAPNDLFILATDGSRGQRIEHPAEDSKPLFVPDGSGVVFASNRRGFLDLWFQAVNDGRPAGEPRLVWRNVGYYGQAEFFTEPGSLVYYFAVNDWGTYTVPLDLASAEPIGEATRLAPINNESNSGAAFSPDGRYLAHFRANAARLVIRELTSGVEREIPFGAQLGSTYAAVDWCSNGDTLVASGYTAGPVAYRVNVKDSSVERLAMTPNSRPSPRCAGNGDAIVYVPTSPTGVRNEVVRRSIASGRETTIYTGDVRVLARSLDGKRLAMVIVDPDGKLSRLVTMSADGGDVSADLMTAATTQFFPQGRPQSLIADAAWMPGGDRLLVVQLGAKEPVGNMSLWEVPVSGAPPRKLNPLRLTPVQGRDLGGGGLTVHPGGKLLAFQRHEGFVQQVWAIDNLAQFIKAGGGW